MLFVLGARDKEMDTIESVVKFAKEKLAYAQVADRRVSPGEAYQTSLLAPIVSDEPVILVECRPPVSAPCTVVIDHHRPGDPGYGKLPAEYWEASSLGQVCTLLHVEPSPELRAIAAYDHCPDAALQGHCPGVDPQAVLRLKVDVISQIGKMSYDDVTRHMESWKRLIETLPRVKIGEVEVVDARGQGALPLPVYIVAQTAALLAHVPILLVQDERRGESTRRKLVLSGSNAPVEAFLQQWGQQEGLVDLYGDPARGFAGGYYTRDS